MSKTVLVIKTSSLGDVIHTLPALSDALRYYPRLQCDWVVEEAFAQIPAWHTAVRQVIPVALRRWRKHPWQTWYSGTWHQFINRLTENQYDIIIDAQGLMKSAWLTYHARGVRCGLDRHSVREPLAALAYQRRYAIDKNLHAVRRIRHLFAVALDYPIPKYDPNYGILSYFQRRPPYSVIGQISEQNYHRFPMLPNVPTSYLSLTERFSKPPTIIFLHGTTWPTKHWPESYWIALALRVTAAGFAVRLPWGNAQEYERAERIAAHHTGISLIPKTDLFGMAVELRQAQAVVGVDTGLAHLAAALAVPLITLYGATQPERTGCYYGPQQQNLQADFRCSPCLRKKCNYRGPSTVYPACYQDLSVEKVWSRLQKLIY
jgi:heptosyltransferase-1